MKKTSVKKQIAPIKKDRKQARAWMIVNSIRLVDVQQALGLRYHTQVGETLAGIRDDQRVLSYLLDRGCPERYLDLPAKMKRAA